MRHSQKKPSMACLINLLDNGVNGVDGFDGVNGVFDNLPWFNDRLYLQRVSKNMGLVAKLKPNFFQVSVKVDVDQKC